MILATSLALGIVAAACGFLYARVTVLQQKVNGLVALGEIQASINRDLYAYMLKVERTVLEAGSGDEVRH